MTSHLTLREAFRKFWVDRRHKEIPPISLVPKEDPTTLFTGSGMQQLVPYLLGAPHPLGKKLYNIQPCFRAQDIEEVGDNRHTTFFEMMGNWSLGSYFKEDQLSWIWELFTEELKIPKHKLFVTAFGGTKEIPRDEETYKVWQKLGVPATRIFYYGAEKNWWSRAGVPEKMPAGEPGGPDSEIFYEFSHIIHNPKFGSKCHPNCDCGRYLEIGNSVFMEYKKDKDGTFSVLPEKNVDFGGGLERILAAINNSPDVFKLDVLSPIISQIEQLSNKKYGKEERETRGMRILGDHIRAAVMIAFDGIFPSNKDQGYILRRLIRKMVRLGKQLGIEKDISLALVPPVEKIFGSVYRDLSKKGQEIKTMFQEEEEKFRKTLERGQEQVDRLLKNISPSQSKPEETYGKMAFDLFQSTGYPPEMFLEDLREKGIDISPLAFNEHYLKNFSKHQTVSKKGADKKFKGGLADTKGQTVKYHTATHLLHQALFDVLGKDVRQEGSNITSERLRFDFTSLKKPIQEDIKKIAGIVNKKIMEKITVTYKMMSREEAFKIGAKAFFKEKYPDTVKVYFVGNYSKEFCGGPHVQNTGEIGAIQIYKLEKIGNNMYRVYAK